MNHSKEWHEERMKGLGGSDIAAALGVSPWKTQLELWGEKTGLAPSTFEGNEATYWGTRMEPVIAERFDIEHASRFHLTTNVRVCSKSHPDYPWMKANIDGLIRNGVERVGIWEAKTAAVEFAELPHHYWLQVQHYMFVYDLPFAIVSVLFHGNKYVEFRVEQDAYYETTALQRLRKFWTNVEQKLPLFDPTSIGDAAIKFHDRVEQAVVEADSTNIELASSISERQKEVKRLTALVKKDKAMLAETMMRDDIKSMTVDKKPIATLVTVASSKVFDLARFKAENPEAYQAYVIKTRKGYTSLRVK